MAGGLLGFLGFGKKEKTNLNDYEKYPYQEDLALTTPLRDIARKRLAGEGLGFGEDFISKSANPAIANIENQWNTQTRPNINSELSRRGVARSAGKGLATDILGRSEHQKNLDVDELIAKFYQLNEAQKKRDLTEGIGLSEDLQNQQADMLNKRSSASERVRDLTAGRADINNQNALSRQNQTLQAAGAVTGNFFGSNAGQGLLDRVGLKGFSQPNSTKTALLGQDDLSNFVKMYQAFKASGAI